MTDAVGDVVDPAFLLPYELDGDDRGALVIHGFTGSPYEMRYVGERLHRRGFTVNGVRLAGHEGGAAALAATGWRDWYASVEAAFDRLSARCRNVAVVGLSLGGLLALRLARHRPEVRAVASLAVPLRLPAFSQLPIQLFRSLGTRFTFPHVPKGLSDIRDSAARRRHPRIVEAIPVRAAIELLDLIELERKTLEEIETPLLVIHSRRDHTALFAGSEELCRRARSRVLRRLTLERSFHVLGVDLERERVADEVADFLATQL